MWFKNKHFKGEPYLNTAERCVKEKGLSGFMKEADRDNFLPFRGLITLIKFENLGLINRNLSKVRVCINYLRILKYSSILHQSSYRVKCS